MTTESSTRRESRPGCRRIACCPVRMVAQRGNRTCSQPLRRGLCACSAPPLLHSGTVDAPTLRGSAPGIAAVSSPGCCLSARLPGRGRHRSSRVFSGTGERARPGAPVRPHRWIPSCLSSGGNAHRVSFSASQSQFLLGPGQRGSWKPCHPLRRRTVAGSPYPRFAARGSNAVVSPLFTRGRPEGRRRGSIGYRVAAFAPSQLHVFAGKLVLCRKDHRTP